MAAPAAGPCSDWTDAATIATCHDTAGIAAGVIAQAIDAASDFLWRASGYRYPGVCTVEGLRPCAQNQCDGGGAARFYGWGEWEWSPAWGYCGCSSPSHRDCGCDRLSEIRLGRAPIVSITQVKVDGAVLVNGTDYRVDDYEWLVRLPRTETWPSCQRLDLADTANDTFSVAFTWGKAPPESGQSAAIDLAWSYIQTCESGDCAPPENTGSVTRQGTAINLIAPERFGFDTMGNLRIGIKSVDRFLMAVPHSRPALIVSPESRADTRRVAT